MWDYITSETLKASSDDEYPADLSRFKAMRKLLLLLTLITTGCAPVLLAPPPPRVRIYGPRVPRVYAPRPVVVVPSPVVVVPAPHVRVW
jgi:hypothetical protein